MNFIKTICKNIEKNNLNKKKYEIKTLNKFDQLNRKKSISLYEKNDISPKKIFTNNKNYETQQNKSNSLYQTRSPINITKILKFKNKVLNIKNKIYEEKKKKSLIQNKSNTTRPKFQLDLTKITSESYLNNNKTTQKSFNFIDNSTNEKLNSIYKKMMFRVQKKIDDKSKTKIETSNSKRNINNFKKKIGKIFESNKKTDFLTSRSRNWQESSASYLYNNSIIDVDAEILNDFSDRNNDFSERNIVNIHTERIRTERSEHIKSRIINKKSKKI